MDIPGVRSKQEPGGVRNSPGFGPAAQGQQMKRPLQWSISGPHLQTSIPQAPFSLHLFPSCSLVAHSELGSLPPAELTSSSYFCALNFGDGIGDPERCLAWIRHAAHSMHHGVGLQAGISPVPHRDWALTWHGWMRRDL